MRTLRYARREVARLTVRRSAADPARPDDASVHDGTEAWLQVGAVAHRVVAPAGALPEAAATTTWSQVIPDAPPLLGSGGDAFEVDRIAVEVTDPRARSLDWEGWLAGATGASLRPIRTVPVRPRVLARAMAFPIHVLQLGQHTLPLEDVLLELFGGRDHDTAFVVTHDPAAATAIPAAAIRPTTADLVHLSLASGAGWLQADRSDRAARHLERLTSRWGTRLLVLEDAPPAELPRWRAVAQALAERGGPAVLVVDGDARLRRCLYAGLVHDQPLDVILHDLRLRGPAELVGGSGREELVRISRIATALPGVADWLETVVVPTPRSIPESADVDDGSAPLETGEGDVFGGLPVVPSPSEALRILDAARQELAALRFDQETTGTLPSSRTARDLQWLYRALGAENRAIEAAPAPPAGGRTVNARLAGQDDAGDGEPLDPRAARLAPDVPVRLEIDIAIPDPTLQRIGSVAFIEKAVTFDPGETETALEVGVTGIDFAVLGSPTQELRLPRHGASDTASFTVVPTAAPPIDGVVRLRFCLYHRNNLIQSYRLVAALEGTPAEPLAKACALALGVGEDMIPTGIQGGYFLRLEYSAFDCDAAGQAPERALSWFANDSAGQNVITAKGEDLFSARVLPDLSGAVERARAALRAISEREGLLPGSTMYAFLQAATPDEWSTAMAELAHKGWQLYSQLVPEELQDEVAEKLSGAGAIIHAAHHDVEHVVPWSLLYMRPYDAGRTQVGGLPVQRAVCPAGMPAADGALDDARCGDRPDCLLHQAHVDAARAAGGRIPLPQTIACPRQLWGFRHVIEVPVQQVAARPAASRGAALATDEARPMVAQVPRNGAVRVMVGYNETLRLARNHLATLENRLATAGAEVPFAPRPTSKRDTILDELATAGSQIIYFYAHARSSLLARDGRPVLGPHLEFEDRPDASGRLEPDNLAGLKLASKPLVFLNGCSTVGFSSSAPSRFIVRFAVCGAAAVIGTETAVWEELAGEMALAFLERFLGGQPAGEALLGARRVLLAGRNPLGLIYTLYGPAQLQLAT